MGKLLLLILIVLILSGCMQVPTAPPKIKNPLMKVFISEECKQKVSEILPDAFEMTHIPGKPEGWYISSKNWADGSSLRDAVQGLEFRRGDEVGQNQNYYYPYPIRWDISGRDILVYTQRIVDENGIVLGDSEIRIKAILEKKEVKNDYLAIFGIVDYEIIYCKLVG